MKRSELEGLDWEFIGYTPAAGMSYYNEKLDMSAIDYRHVLKVYSNRTSGPGKQACFFSKCFLYDPVTGDLQNHQWRHGV